MIREEEVAMVSISGDEMKLLLPHLFRFEVGTCYIRYARISRLGVVDDKCIGLSEMIFGSRPVTFEINTAGLSIFEDHIRENVAFPLESITRITVIP